ncbi:hypothetical protein SP695_004645 [Salmonella enterica]|nr:hypothetical protein [Salmonella enterica]
MSFAKLIEQRQAASRARTAAEKAKEDQIRARIKSKRERGEPLSVVEWQFLATGKSNG